MGRPVSTTIRTDIRAYSHLTSPEAATAKKQNALLVLPVGALEQHGGGLPLGTDSIRAEYVAERVVDRMPGRSFVLPPVPYGVSPHHRTLPGTISLTPSQFIDIVTQIATELADVGWTRLLVITGHGGNSAALGVVQQSLLGTHPDFAFAFSPVSTLATEAHKALDRTEVSGHSGESETAQVLAIDESLVHRPGMRPGATGLDQLDGRALLSRASGPKVAVTFDRYADNGVLGDPTTVTADDGRVILDEVVDKLVDFAERLSTI